MNDREYRDIGADEFAELSAGHALNALSLDDERAYQAALAAHPEWEQVARLDAAAIDVLADGIPPVAPPLDLRSRLMRAIDTDESPTAADAAASTVAEERAETAPVAPPTEVVQAVQRRNWTRGLFALVASVALLVAIGWGTGAVTNLWRTPAAVTALEQIQSASTPRRRRSAPGRRGHGALVGQRRQGGAGRRRVARAAERSHLRTVVRARNPADRGGHLRRVRLGDHGGAQRDDAARRHHRGDHRTGRRLARRQSDHQAHHRHPDQRLSPPLRPPVAWNDERRAPDYHRPVHRPADTFDRRFGSTDPADVSRIAHATASALITRVRDEPTDAVVERLITFTDAHGLETVAELWSHSPAKSLPGTLWRLYLLQLMVRDDAATAALLYERGARCCTVDDVAGAPTPAGPEELITLVDEILRGVFTGDFAVALERAASFCASRPPAPRTSPTTTTTPNRTARVPSPPGRCAWTPTRATLRRAPGCGGVTR
jgi:hypothetical protein